MSNAAFAISDMAENWYEEAHKTAVTYHDGEFNVLANGESVEIKEKDGKFYAVVVNNDFNTNDYNVPEYVGSEHDSLDDVMAYLNQFRGDEHQDFHGLELAIAAIKDDR